MNKRYLIISLLLVFIAAGGYFYWNNLKNTNPPQQKNITDKKKVLPKEVTVTLDKKGFTPAEISIKVGSAVRWKNTSGDKQTVNSDDYPTNQKHRELNFGIFNDGSSVVYTFTKAGEYGYHNQLKPGQKGKVIVKE